MSSVVNPFDMTPDERALLPTEPIVPDDLVDIAKQITRETPIVAEAGRRIRDGLRLADLNPTTIHERISSQTNIDHLSTIAREDVEGLKKAQKSYGDSWKKRGGVGAFMMLARKWDRLENAMTTPASRFVGADGQPIPESPLIDCYDIFARTLADKRVEGIIDDIRDLRRYLLLVESELRARGIVHGTHRDNVPESPPRHDSTLPAYEL